MIDLSVYQPSMQRNEAHAGIELSFASKPSREAIDELKKHGFRWHSQKKLWFAKHTPERYQFAADLLGLDAQKTESDTPLQESKINDSNGKEHRNSHTKAQAVKKPNTFAAHYETIGDAKILPKAEGRIFTHMEAFFQEEKLYFRRTYGGDSITLLDLKNAQKTGAVCEEWYISPDYLERTDLLTLLRRAGVEDLRSLVDLCRSGEVPDGLSVSVHQHKGVDVFSPFVEVKPLKALPEKWTKRNFTQALMSGQLFRGEVAYRHTDDYAYDSAVGFRSGVGLDMPNFVKNEVGDWGVCTSCYNSTAKADEHGVHAVAYSEHSNSSKTLWFDVTCDIAEGKRRAEDRAQSIERYNHMLESSCLTLTPEQIDPNKCYSILTLDTQTNTGVHDTKSELVQGHVLQEYLGPNRLSPDILSVQELEIEPSHFYTIADFFHRRDHAEDDSRIIGCGNWKQIVTGKALLELTREGVHFPVLLDNDPEYSTHASAYTHLASQANGASRFMFSKQVDYLESIDRLDKEFRRAGQNALEDLIYNASTRQESYGKEPSPPDYER